MMRLGRMLRIAGLLSCTRLAGATAQAPGLLSVRPALDSLARSIAGRIGAAVMIVETGEVVSVRGNERFPMQSVYKVPIAMAVLARVDSGTVKLSDQLHVRKVDMVAGIHSPIRDMTPNGTRLSVRELLRAAVVESDGTASDMLLVLAPPVRVTAMLRTLAIDSMVVATTERGMAADVTAQYRNWSTPLGAVQLLRALESGPGLSATGRHLLLDWMTQSASGERRLKGGVPAGVEVAHKTGTDATRSGLTRATNDVGLVTLPDGRHLAIAVFVADSRASEAEREGVIAAVAHAAWDGVVAPVKR